MILKIKKLHPDAKTPLQAHSTDAGYDLVAIDNGSISEDYRYIEYRTGIALSLSSGYHARIHPRSSISKYDLVLCNGIGLIDNEYRGELFCRFKIVPLTVTKHRVKTKDAVNLHGAPLYVTNFQSLPDDIKPEDCEECLYSYVGQIQNTFFEPIVYKKGDKIAQLVIEKTEYVQIEEVEDLGETVRGSGGFGSSGH